MDDRIPTRPGRMLLTPENGAAPFYATLERADQPTQAGTQLNKNSLLKDATAALYGLGSDAVPDDVLALLKPLVDSAQNSADVRAKIEMGSYVGTGTYGQNHPNSLTFDFEPAVLIMLAYSRASNSYFPILSYYQTQYTNIFPCYILNGTDFVGYQFAQYNSNYPGGAIARTADKKTLKWYAVERNNSGSYNDSSVAQFNQAGTEYFYVAIG